MKNSLPIFLSTILVSHSLAVSAAEYQIYTVKKGEMLSELLDEMDFAPLYGKKGYVKKIYELNPNKIKKNGDFVVEGEVIILPMQMKREIASVDVLPPLAPIEVAAEQPRSIVVPPAEVVPAPVPVQKNEMKESDSNEQYSYLRVSPQVSWLKVNSTASNTARQSDINALSKASPGALIFYGIKYDNKLSFSLFSYVSQINFYSDSQYNFQNRSFFRTAFGGGVDYNATSSQSLGARLGYFDEFFLSSPSSGVVAAQVVHIPEAHFSYRKKFLEYKKATVSYGLLGKVILPYSASNVQGQLGYGAGADLMVGFAKKSIRFFYNYSEAKAKNQSTTTSEIGWNAIFEVQFLE